MDYVPFCTMFPFGRVLPVYQVDLRNDQALPEISQMLQFRCLRYVAGEFLPNPQNKQI
jgi:hypothetical protein